MLSSCSHMQSRTQEDQEYAASLDYIARPCVNKTTPSLPPKPQIILEGKERFLKAQI